MQKAAQLRAEHMCMHCRTTCKQLH